MTNGIPRSIRSGIAGLLAGAAGWTNQALANGVNLQEPASVLARSIYDLHTIITLICVVIFIGVFGVMFYSVYAHRKSKGHKAAQFHENVKVEIAWTVIPLIILIAMMFPATRTVLEMKDTAAADITIKVTGYQWKWGYDYLQDGFGFYSTMTTPMAQIEGREAKTANYLLEVDNPLVVPVGKKIRVLITANDVLHSWWMPVFGVKQDAIPGFVRDSWFTANREGTFRGQCAELCGKEHGFMPIVVEVVSEPKYVAWVADQKKKAAAVADDPNKVWDLAALVARGEKVYANNCVACHQATGKGVPPAFPPLDGSPKVTGPKLDQIHILLEGVMRDGKATAMVSFAKQLSDTDIAAAITYTRNSWGNKTGEAIQPAEIKAARK
ncbi:MAG: cytochrome c oxidase subunit II [Burkholderiales bacterium]|nr:cytochrome c oxidase subunit II [Burkholderiales bacterium]